MPKHKQEPIPQSTFETVQQPYVPLEIPGLAPDDELAFVESEAVPLATDETAPLDFEIPALVEDDEPVPPRELESTNPGVLGFSIPRPRTPAPQRERSTMYAYGSQRREEIEHFTELAAQKERERLAQVTQYGIARRALNGAGYVTPASSNLGDAPRGLSAMER